MSTDSETIIVVVAVAILIILSVTIAVIVMVTKKRKEKMMQLSEQDLLGGGIKGTDHVAGVDYAYQHFQGAKNSPPFFKVTVRCSSPGAFKIARETKFDRFFKKMGICTELSTGDLPFDDTFYITTDVPGFTRHYLGKSEKRRAIMEIFEYGFNQIILTGDMVTAAWNGFPHNNSIEKKKVEEIATRLGLLSGEMPNIFEYEQVTTENNNWKLKRSISFAIPILLLVSGIVGLIAGLSAFTPLDPGAIILNSFKYSLPFFLFFVWVAVKLLRGRSSSHRELLIVFILSIFGVIVGGMGIEMTLNGLLDKNDPSVFRARVIDKYYSKSKNNYSYFAVLESWREEKQTEKISINHAFYENLTAGESQMTIITKPGKFGFPWLVNYRE